MVEGLLNPQPCKGGGGQRAAKPAALRTWLLHGLDWDREMYISGFTYVSIVVPFGGCLIKSLVHNWLNQQKEPQWRLQVQGFDWGLLGFYGGSGNCFGFCWLKLGFQKPGQLGRGMWRETGEEP